MRYPQVVVYEGDGRLARLTQRPAALLCQRPQQRRQPAVALVDQHLRVAH